MIPKVMLLIAVAGFALCFAGSSIGPSNILRRFGYQEGFAFRTSASRAVKLINILDPQASLRAVWDDSSNGGIPVVLINEPSRLGRGPSWVPKSGEVIFLNSAALNGLRHLFRQTNESAHQVSSQYLIALLLLHELGHIRHLDRGSFEDASGAPVPRQEINLDDYNLVPTESKFIEARADRFVANLVARAGEAEGPRKAASARFSYEIERIVVNFVAERGIEEFLGNGEEKIYWDHGYSHPNLQLRLLIINYLINPSEYGARVLQSFLEKVDNKPSINIPNLEGRFRETPQIQSQSDTMSGAERICMTALAAAEAGEYEFALRTLTYEIHSDPDNALLYYTRARILSRAGRFTDALVDCDRAIDCEASLAFAHTARGWILVRLDREDEALDAYEESINLNPVDVDTRINRGTLLLGLGRNEQALMDFSEAVRLDFASANGHFGRAVALSNLSQHDLALAAVEIALELNPEFLEARKLHETTLELLASPRSNPVDSQ